MRRAAALLLLCAGCAGSCGGPRVPRAPLALPPAGKELLVGGGYAKKDSWDVELPDGGHQVFERAAGLKPVWEEALALKDSQPGDAQARALHVLEGTSAADPLHQRAKALLDWLRQR